MYEPDALRIFDQEAGEPPGLEAAKGKPGGPAAAGTGCGHVAEAVEERWWLDQGFESVVLFGEGL